MDWVFGLFLFTAIILAFLSYMLINAARRNRLRKLITLQGNYIKKHKKRGKGYLAVLEGKARLAGYRLSAMELMGISLVLAALIFAIGLFLFQKVMVAVLVCLLGFYLPEKYMDVKIKKRAAIMLEQLEKLLPSLANYLRAGYSLPQALANTGNKISEPMGSTITYIRKQLDASVPVVKALENAADSVPITEFKLMVLATKINFLIGGNLSDIYDTIAKTIGERREMREHMKAYTSEARLNSTIVGGMAFAMVAIFRVISPGYFDPLLSTTSGQVFFSICVGLMVVGWFTVRKMSEPRF